MILVEGGMGWCGVGVMWGGVVWGDVGWCGVGVVWCRGDVGAAKVVE